MADFLIGIADMQIGRASDTLTTLGLGSCVGLVLYDRISKIGGLAHIMLPLAPSATEIKFRAKYADTALDDLIKQMIAAGADPKRLVSKLAGGAHMFDSSTNNDIMKVGLRNVDTCHRLLSQKSIAIIAEETGGNIGRTIVFDCNSGCLTIRTAFPRNERYI